MTEGRRGTEILEELKAATEGGEMEQSLEIYSKLRRLECAPSPDSKYEWVTVIRSLRRSLRRKYVADSRASRSSTAASGDGGGGKDIANMDFSALVSALADGDAVTRRRSWRRAIPRVILCIIDDMDRWGLRIGSSEVTDRVYFLRELGDWRGSLAAWEDGVRRQDEYINTQPLQNDSFILGIAAHNFAIAAAVDSGDAEQVKWVYQESVKAVNRGRRHLPENGTTGLNSYTFQYLFSRAAVNCRLGLGFIEQVTEDATRAIPYSDSNTWLVIFRPLLRLALQGSSSERDEALHRIVRPMLVDTIPKFPAQLRASIAVLLFSECRRFRRFEVADKVFGALPAEIRRCNDGAVWNSYLTCKVSEAVAARRDVGGDRQDPMARVEALAQHMKRYDNVDLNIHTKSTLLWGLARLGRHREAAEYFSRNRELHSSVVAVDIFVRVLLLESPHEGRLDNADVFWDAIRKLSAATTTNCRPKQGPPRVIDARIINSVLKVLVSRAERLPSEVREEMYRWLLDNSHPQDFYALTTSIGACIEFGWIDSTLEYYQQLFEAHGASRNLIVVTKRVLRALAKLDVMEMPCTGARPGTQQLRSRHNHTAMTTPSSRPANVADFLSDFPRSRDFIGRYLDASQLPIAYATLMRALLELRGRWDAADNCQDLTDRAISLLSRMREALLPEHTPCMSAYNLLLARMLRTGDFRYAQQLRVWILSDLTRGGGGPATKEYVKSTRKLLSQLRR
ncbi:hypothetical protein EV182_004100 [Spiromyces aspiralis]|uniref:Uncharacterized protein n=1 Tax=Spiromyces aspiralis TaxID=68401 RepID=A0ACC1HG11_9FUNG|nr:hypothetical protein EV182_004100 [Spiromyces aspiralis]